MTDIERVAGAIADTQVPAEDGSASASMRQLFMQLGEIVPGGFNAAQFDNTMSILARAALQAIREPSPGMVEAGEHVAVRGFIPAGQFETVIWHAMVDAALEEI